MPLENCQFCRGTGWKLISRDQAIGAQDATLVSLDKPGAAAGRPNLSYAVPCECTLKERAGRSMDRARIPKRYEHCDFESYVVELADDRNYTAEHAASLKQAKMIAQAFVRDYPAGDQTGLLLMGNSGVGKTHLAVAALRELIRRGHNGYFCEYGSLLREIQNSYKADSEVTEMRLLEPVLSVEVLIIDDLGCIKPSDWVRDTIGYILNTRYAEGSRDLSQPRCTIITTNYLDQPKLEGESSKLSSGKIIPSVREDSLAQRIGDRMRSRLYEMCRAVEIFAPDFRKQLRQSTRAGA
jgi:DNA replication protein DnaC